MKTELHCFSPVAIAIAQLGGKYDTAAHGLVYYASFLAKGLEEYPVDTMAEHELRIEPFSSRDGRTGYKMQFPYEFHETSFSRVENSINVASEVLAVSHANAFESVQLRIATNGNEERYPQEFAARVAADLANGKPIRLEMIFVTSTKG